MTWATFQDLMEQLCPHLEWQDTNVWQTFPLGTQLVIALVKLATPTSLHNVGHLFSMGKVTAKKAVLQATSCTHHLSYRAMSSTHDIYESSCQSSMAITS
ncbi:hypothetical protein Y1Q_0024490 [Alligator mississippiensis]|uniref:Uncharacterized protein n=1 Tax=Alligator mississippiensis TaxID=8496 RepID=A0A151NAQ8_ALLMI|nr:hypothetical protein Y1Q_0024490 [Alligator mississippiensis]